MRVIAPVEVLYGSPALRDSRAPGGPKKSRPPIFSPVKKSKKYRVIKMAHNTGVFERAPVARKARATEQRSLARRGNDQLEFGSELYRHRPVWRP